MKPMGDLFNLEPKTTPAGPVECLGMTFPNDEERRKHFLGILHAGLEELRERLSVPFVSFDDTYNRLKSLEQWPLGTDGQVHDLARCITEAARSSNQQPGSGNQELLDLYKAEVGFPIGSDEDILAVGTTDPLADVATQAHVTARMSNPEPTPDRLPKKGTGAPWGDVYGELLTFDDPETRLPAIDRLEGFRPGGPCLYRRVLVPVRANGTGLPAWLYVAGDRCTGGCKELTGGIWR